MKKRFVSLFLLASMFLCISTAAVEMRKQTITTKLSFSGTTANCILDVTAEKSEKIEGTMELWQGNTLVNSWSSEDTGWLSMEETQRVSKGKTYTFKAYGTIGGKPFTVTPTTKTCN